jgi:transposase
METRQSRMQVDQFRTQLTGADVLRDDQVEPLITALHAERSQMQRDLEEFGRTLDKGTDPMGTQRKYLERETELTKEAYGRMKSSAAAILSSTQLQKLDDMLKRDIARRETQLRMQRIQSKFEPSAEVAGNPD